MFPFRYSLEEMMKSKLSTVLPVAVALLLTSGPAFAEGGAAAGDAGYLGLGAGLGMGLAVLGAALGQGRIGGSAMEGMARNPEAGGDIRTSMLLGMAFPESLVLFTFGLGFLLLGKIG